MIEASVGHTGRIRHFPETPVPAVLGKVPLRERAVGGAEHHRSGAQHSERAMDPNSAAPSEASDVQMREQLRGVNQLHDVRRRIAVPLLTL